MNREEFLKKVQNREITFTVNLQKASWMVNNGLVGKTEYYALHFWSTISLLLHIVAPLSLFWLKWYWAVLIFILARMLWKSVKQSNKDFVLEKAFINETFFNLCIKHGVLIIKNK